MEDEEWRPIAGYVGWYEVSSLGRIRRIGRAKSAHPGLILTPNRGTISGRLAYMEVKLTTHNIKKRQRVHRLVAVAFLPVVDGCTIINHLNSDKTDNRVANLEWTTHKGNWHHAFDNGRVIRLPNGTLRGAHE